MVIVQTFLSISFMTRSHRTMAELIHLAQSFMNIEDTIITKKKKKGERLDNGYIHHPEQGLSIL